MTTIHQRRPRHGAWQTWATVRSAGRIREVCIALEPACLALRLKGTRQEYRLPWSTAFMLAVDAHVRSEKRRKAEERKARRAGGGR